MAKDVQGATTSGRKSLMAVLAHPDDEALGIGGTLAKYAAEGVRITLVTATLGQRGRIHGRRMEDPVAVGHIREAELRESARCLGIEEPTVLGWMDGDVAMVDPLAAADRIADEIRRIRPEVVVTFGADGAYGHPDHIAISQHTSSAIVRAAAGSSAAGAAHAVSKLYWIAWTAGQWDRYQAGTRVLSSTVGGVTRTVHAWEPWAVTTRIDARDHWRAVWSAVRCHDSQIAVYGRLPELTDEELRDLWGGQEFYRVFSTVNGGSVPETDLFDGLRGGAGRPGD